MTVDSSYSILLFSNNLFICTASAWLQESSDAGSHRSSHNGGVHAVPNGKHHDHTGIPVIADSHIADSNIKQQLLQETANMNVGHAGSPVIVRAS
jgi:hypothetical protein